MVEDESEPKEVNVESLVGQNLEQNSKVENEQDRDQKFWLFVFLLVLLAIAGFVEMNWSQSCDSLGSRCFP